MTLTHGAACEIHMLNGAVNAAVTAYPSSPSAWESLETRGETLKATNATGETEIQKAPMPLPGPAFLTFRGTEWVRSENAPQTKHPWFPGRKPGRRLSEFGLSVGRSGEIRTP